MKTKLTSLTAYEVEALRSQCNMADGHAKLSPAVGGLTREDLLKLSIKSQAAVEREFIEAFSSVSGQDFTTGGVVFFPSASAAIDTVAKFLVGEGCTKVALMEPVFDNLALLLMRAGIQPIAIPEDAGAIVAAVESNDAVFLVAPNNPTGWLPEESLWAEISESLHKTAKLLVVDRTFRLFAGSSPGLDSLVEGNPFVISIDDTGKTWSTLECKVSFVSTCDQARRERIQAIAEEITLNVSPISLTICTEAIRIENGISRLASAIKVNRLILDPVFDSLGFHRLGSPLSFALLAIPSWFKGDDCTLVHTLAMEGLAALPVSKFFWRHPWEGSRLIRFSLARRRETAEQAAVLLTRFIGKVGDLSGSRS